MSNIVALKQPELNASQLRLIQKTIAKDTNSSEFDLFIELCKAYGLNPIRKEVHCVIYNKNDAEKRKMTLITSVDGYRVIAERTNRYRPDEDAPRFEYDNELKGEFNPLGLVSAAVSVWKQDNLGQWHKSTSIAYWDEYAPKEYGKLKDNWKKMGRIMLSKCAEALALRKAFPDAFSGLYTEDEIEKTTIDITASEILHKEIAEKHQLNIDQSIAFQIEPQDALEAIPLGKVADKILEAARNWVDIRQLEDFNIRNRDSFKMFWAARPDDAFEVKRELEKLAIKLAAA